MTTSNSIDIAASLSKFFKDLRLPVEVINHITAKLTSERLAKGDYFQEEDKVCNRVAILLKGLLVASYHSKDGRDEKTSRFFYSPRNIVVTSFESFATQQPGTESILALEDSYLLCIQKKDLDYLYDKNPDMERIGRRLAEQSYIQALRRNRSLQENTAAERIADFRKQHRELVGHPAISIQQIASYLGMDRKTYTREAKYC
jgi:CRP-like cAMP-binding protein